jgi:hypothetical protein
VKRKKRKRKKRKIKKIKTMEIKPTYVTFEQAKLLKEKDFDEKCRNYYTPEGKEYVNGWGDSIEDTNGFSTNEHNPLFVFDYSDFNKNQKKQYYLAPEQWQVVEWLRINHGIWVRVEPDGDWWGQIKSNNIPYARIGKWLVITALAPYKSPQEAYSTAIDYTLNNLI